MDYSFNVQIASKYGVESAVLIHNLYWWIAKNMANDKHYYDGRYWTYNSQDAFQKLFPFWTKRQLRYVFDKLKSDNVILIGNYNKTPMDRTAWYALNNEVLEIYGSTGGFDFIACEKENSGATQKQGAIATQADDELAATEANFTVSAEESILENGTNHAKNAHMTKLSNASDKNVTMQVTKVSNASDKSVTMHVTKVANASDKSGKCTSYKPINKSINNQSNNQDNKDIYSSIYPLPHDGLIDGTEQIDAEESFGENTSTKLTWYKNWLIEKFSERDYEQLGEIRQRFVNLVNDIAQQDSIVVGGIPIKAEEILCSYVSLFSESGNPLLEAYDTVIEKIASGAVKNQFKYAVSTLYNASRVV